MKERKKERPSIHKTNNKQRDKNEEREREN